MSDNSYWLGVASAVIGMNVLVKIFLAVVIGGVLLATVNTLFPLVVVIVSLLAADFFISAFPSRDKKMKEASIYMFATAIGVIGAVFSIYGGIGSLLSQSFAGQALVAPTVNFNIPPVYAWVAGGLGVLLFIMYLGSKAKYPRPVALIGILVLLTGSLLYVVIPKSTVCPDGGLVCDDPVQAYTVVFPEGYVSNCLLCGDGNKIVIEPSTYSPTSTAQGVGAQSTSKITLTRTLKSCTYTKSTMDVIGELGTVFDRKKVFNSWELSNVPAGTYVWSVEAQGILGEYHKIDGVTDLGGDGVVCG